MDGETLSGYYEGYEQQNVKKDFQKLLSYLKLFQARAKVILLLTDGDYVKGTDESIKAAMQPFLDKKLMQIVVSGEGVEVQYR